MRGIGLVENTTALDWIDRSHFKNDIMVKKHYKKIKYWKYLEPALNTIGNSKYLADSLSYGIKNLVTLEFGIIPFSLLEKYFTIQS